MLGRLVILGVAAFGSAALTATSASAGEWYDFQNWMSAGAAVTSQSEGPWRVNVGAGVAAAPVYLGGDEYDAKPLPLIDLDYRNFIFLSTQRGFGFNYIRRRNLKVGARLTIDYGRDSADAERLRGLPDVDAGVEAGIFFEAFTGSWRFQGDLRQEIASGHGGFLASADVAYGGRLSDNMSLFLGAGLTYMGKEYADAYFSVPAGAPLPAFEASSGLRDISPYAQLVYHFTPRFYAALEGRAYMLMGDLSDSPIVENDLPFTGSFLVGYRF
jgi:outer membrane scaffolding protein for murein synthesis (MipA/OmpV family)